MGVLVSRVFCVYFNFVLINDDVIFERKLKDEFKFFKIFLCYFVDLLRIEKLNVFNR